MGAARQLWFSSGCAHVASVNSLPVVASHPPSIVTMLFVADKHERL
jgi:hypothetical protein